jgi:hypothetical protein
MSHRQRKLSKFQNANYFLGEMGSSGIHCTVGFVGARFIVYIFVRAPLAIAILRRTGSIGGMIRLTVNSSQFLSIL